MLAMDPSRRAFFRGRPPPPADPVAQIGPGCLASRGVDCRICGDHCDARAIRFPPRLGGSPQPVLDAEACTGCGDCVTPCPASAISMAARSS